MSPRAPGGGLPALAILCIAMFCSGPDALAQVPDLTAGGVPNNTKRVNLGPTGMRGWCYQDGVKTPNSRQILVTELAAGSPADGIVAVDDVILGANGTGAEPTLFTSDARKTLGLAIGDAEARNPATLKLLRWRNGTTTTVTLTLESLGAYSATAPYNCPKSAAILDKALDVIMTNVEPSDGWNFNALALLAANDPSNPNNAARQAKAAALVQSLILSQSDIDLYNSGHVSQASSQGWHWGHKLIVLAEYYLQTGDATVLDSLRAHALHCANGQSLLGNIGHRFSQKASPDSPNPAYGWGYGPVNSAAVPMFYGLTLAKKSGITDPEVLLAIERAKNYFSFYVDRGAISYGDDQPTWVQSNNGKNSCAALAFQVDGTRDDAVKYFSRASIESHVRRDSGHTGSFFQYLWTPLGANAAGPDGLSAYFAELNWQFDLYRRWNGTFEFSTYSGNTSGNPASQWRHNLHMSTAVLLTYAAPLNQLYMTGKGQDPAKRLSPAEAAQAAADGNYSGAARTTAELLGDLGSPAFLVRWNAATTLEGRSSEHAALLPTLHTMATSDPDLYKRSGACFALGRIKDASSAPVLAGLFSDPEDRIRWVAAQALEGFPKESKLSVLDTILAAVAAEDAPILPLKPGDPLHLTQERIGNSLFNSSGALIGHNLVGIDRNLLYPVIRSIANHPKAQIRAWLSNIYPNLNQADFAALADVIVDATLVQAPSNNHSNVRFAGIKALRQRGYAEGVPLGEITMRYFDADKPAWTRPPIWDEIQAYAGSNTTVTPDPDIKGFCEYFIGINFEKTRAQAVINAIEADLLPAKLVPLKRIDWIFPDSPQISLPKNWTVLRVDATDLAKGDSVFTWRKVHGVGEVTFIPNGTGDARNATVVFDGTPGQYLFEVTMSDSRGLTEVSKTVAVTLTPSGGDLPPNSPPTANSQSLTAGRGTPTPLTLTGSDPEGRPLNFTVTRPPGKGVLSGTAPYLTYTSDLGYTGPDSLTFEVVDSEGLKSSATVEITVTPVTAGVAVYEPFHYPAGSLQGLSGTSAVGFASAWTAASQTQIASGSLTWGALNPIGNSIGNLASGNFFGGSRAIHPAALAANGLLDDGATLWFSMILGGETLSVALANSSFSTTGNQHWIVDEGAQAGSGLGVRLSGRLVTATHFRNAAAGSSPVLGSWDDSYGLVLSGQNRLVVGKIQWGSGSDLIEVYLPKSDLLLPETPSSVLTAVVDQSTFDTLTFTRNGVVVLDEIRFGATYGSVLQGTVAMTPDTVAPTPDPMGFTLAPTPAGPSTLRMVATPASDPLGVEYFFHCTAGGGNDSGWQESNTYLDTGLTPGVSYSYTVKARDKHPGNNETAASPVASAIIPVETTVPDVVGMVQSVAESVIADASLAVGTVLTATEYSNSVPAGHVLSQTPAGGADAPYGSAVDLVISIGSDPALPTLLPVDIVDDQGGGPVVVNTPMTYTLTFSKDMDHTTVDASDFINAGDAAISIGTITETSPGVFTVQVTPISTGILRFAVAAGAQLIDAGGDALNTAADIIDDTVVMVTLPPVTVPNVVGLSRSAAESALTAASLIVGAESSIFHPTAPAGNVLSQDPAAGSSIPEQSPVGLVVSLGPGPDVIAPLITALNPTDGAINIPVTNNLLVTFNENIAIGSGEVVIRNLTDSIETIIQIGDTSQISISANILTINPLLNLLPGKAYGVRIAPGAVKDLAGNDHSGINNHSAWNFSTANGTGSTDLVAPAIADFVPETGSQFVSLTDNLILTFNESVQVVRGRITLKNLTNFTERVINVNDVNQVIVTGSVLQINPTDPLEENCFYAVRIDANAIFDLAGNSFPGISDDTRWLFYTGEIVDDTPPAVVALTPTDGASNVPHSSNLVMIFDKAVMIGSGNLAIRNLADSTETLINMADASQVSVAGTIVTIDPANYLGEGVSYAIRIESGAIKDLAGNAFPGISDDSTWNFTTSPNNPPAILTLSPAHQSYEVAVHSNLTVTFDEPVAVGSGSIRIKNLSNSIQTTIEVTDSTQVSFSGAVLTINPTSVLNAASPYAVLIDAGAVQDLDGNAFAGIASEAVWTFTTRADPFAEVFREDFEVSSGNPDVNFAGSLGATSRQTGPKWVRGSTGFKASDHGIVDESSGLFTDPTGEQGYAFRYSSTGITTAEARIGTLTAGKRYHVSFHVTEDGNSGGGSYNVGLLTFAPGASRTDTQSMGNLASKTLTSVTGSHAGKDYKLVSFQYVTNEGADAAVLGHDLAVRVRGSFSFGIIDNVVVSITDTVEPTGPPTLAGTDIVDDRGGADVNLLDPVLYTVTFNKGMNAASIDASDFGNAGSASIIIGAVSEISSLGVFTVAVTPTSAGTLRLRVNQGAVLLDKSGLALDTGTAIADDTVITVSESVTVPNVVGLAQAAAESNIVTAGLVVGTVGSAYSNTIAAGTIVSQNPNGGSSAPAGSPVNLIVSLGPEPDTTAPVIVSLLPQNGALAASVGDNLVVTFSEDIMAGNGFIILKNLSTETSIGIDVSDTSQVSMVGAYLVINPAADLGLGSYYAVRIEATAIRDFSGNYFAGINNDATWNFTTVAAEDGQPRDNPFSAPGGPYTVLIGTTLSLDGSASLPSDGATITSYEWDLNNDGIFGDATGATPAAIAYATLTGTHGMVQGPNTIRLRVTDSAAKKFVAAGTVTLLDSVTYTGANGAWDKDTWNQTANWDNGISGAPTGGIDVKITAGKIPWAVNATPAYNGNLTLGTNSTLGIGNSATNTPANALGTGTITMSSGSKIIMRLGANYTFNQAFALTGPATVALSSSTAGHNNSRTFATGFSGAHPFTLEGQNGNTANLNTANGFSSLTATTAGSSNWKVVANAAGSLGTGDVTINSTVNLVVAAAGAMNANGKLNLNGARSTKVATETTKLILNANLTVAELWIGGVQRAAGEYTRTSGLLAENGEALISGSGTLTVTGPGGSPFDDWAGNFDELTDPDPARDFDNGGLATALEWVLGGDPTDPSDDAGLAPTIDNKTDPDGKLLFIFRRSVEAAADENTTIAVQYGDKLTGWTAATHQGTAANQITVTEQANGFGQGIDKVTVALPPSLAGQGKLFVRLSVQVTGDVE